MNIHIYAIRYLFNHEKEGNTTICNRRVENLMPLCWQNKSEKKNAAWCQGVENGNVSQSVQSFSYKINIFLGCNVQLGDYSQQYCLTSVQFSRSVVSNSLRPQELQHARPPCPSLSLRVSTNSCPLSYWCHPTISSSGAPLSSCSQSFPASDLFKWVSSLHQMSNLSIYITWTI